ncbi:uncharacterized protein [Diadema antillarum]|uniref:uncharacterized protein n=1 Tax=Diadema antillarum TaxID=105358 RepID=UPI003A84B7E3
MPTAVYILISAICLLVSIQPQQTMALDPKLIATISGIVKTLANEEGQFEIKGRVVKYKAEGRVHSFKEPWVYDGTAWDIMSGISEKARHYKSKQGAIEHAVVRLMERLKRDNIIKDEL